MEANRGVQRLNPPCGREAPTHPALGRVLGDDPRKRDCTALALKRLARTGALPSLPEVAARGAALARDPESGRDELYSVIASDPGLAARVLRLAHFDPSARLPGTDALSRSIDRIGLRKIRDLLLAVGSNDFYHPSNPAGHCLWVHSLAAGVISGELAAVARVDPREASLMALLHAVGRMVFLLVDPQWLDYVDGNRDLDPSERTELERAHFGYCEQEARTQLFSHWGLPIESNGAAHWQTADSHVPGAMDLTKIVSRSTALASRLGYPLGGGDLAFGHDPEWLVGVAGGEQGLQARIESRLRTARGRLS